MLKIGITGGIGSGKSVVCKIFANLGIPIYDADAMAKELIVNDPEIKKAIIESFGPESYNERGEYQKSHISNIVFKDKSQLEILNKIVHPKVINYFPVWALTQKEAPYVLKEAAILFESGSNLLNDYSIMVYSSLEQRIKRVMARDGITETQVLDRMKNQMPDEEKLKLVDFVIYNDDEHSLIEQVMELHQKFVQQ